MIDVNLLPRELRRVKEPSYWRLIALLFPIVMIAAVFLVQLQANERVNTLTAEVQQLEDQLALLQPALREQADLQARQGQLQDLLAVSDEISANRINWTDAIVGLLEILPGPGPAGERRIDFQSLSLTALNAPQSNPNRFEGRPIVAEMTVNGNVIDTAVLADFIRALEDSDRYGVSFQRTVLDEENSVYGYSLAVGMHEGATNETP